MKNSNKNLIISISGILIAVAAIFAISLTISGSIINTAFAAGNFEISVVETGGRRACQNMPPFSNTGSRYFTYTVSVENHSDKEYRINKAAFHSKTAGCGFYDGSPAGSGWKVISGEQTYASGQSGTLVLRYDVNSQNCGRVQYDAGYYAKDGSTGSTVFIGDVINYGVDCDSPPPPPPPPPPTVSCSISANPTSILAGNYSTLNWTSQNATSCTASNAWSGAKSLSGTQSVSPSLTSNYILTCNGAGGTANCSTTVNIINNPAPTCSISANPTSILAGNYSTLNWTSQNATSCTASNAWSGTKFLFGTQYVAPSSDSTYSLNCSGPGGSVTCSASIAVTSNLAPTCSIAANPTTISEDEYSVLNWTSSNATSCTASNAWSGSKSFSGTQSVSPNYDSTYTLTCHNSSASVSCSTYVLVREDNAELEIDKLVRNISNGTGFSNSVHAEYDDELEFSLKVHSDGSDTAENVRVWDNLPSHLTYISGSTTLDGSYRGDGITTGGIYIGDLYSGQTKTIKFKVRVSSQNYNNDITLTNYGYANADNVNYVYDTASIIIEGGEYGTANLKINKLVRNITNGTGFYDSVNAKLGDEIEFSIDLSSIGNKEANNVKVWDNLPSGLTYVSGSTTINGSYFSDGIVSGGIYIGTINAGANKEVKFRAKVAGSISGTSGVITVDVGNQNVQTSGNISVSKMGRNITQNQTVWSYSVPAYYGDTLEISIQATNNSGSTVNNVVVKEILPSSLSLVSGSIDIINGINLGTMANGQTRTIKFRVIVIGGTSNVVSGVLNNIAYANANNISQIYDQASVVISGQSGEVLGASVVTGMGLTPFLFILMAISLIITFFVYCRLREEKILDYLNKEKGSKFLKFLIGLYFKIKLRFKLANVRFKQVYL